MQSTMPEKTPLQFPESSSRMIFSLDRWQLKHIKLHHPEHTETECQTNLAMWKTHDPLNRLSFVRSMLTQRQAKASTRYHTWNRLITLHTWCLNDRHIIRWGRQYTPELVPNWVISLQIESIAALRVAFRWTYKTYPPTHLQTLEDIGWNDNDQHPN